jgi:hypothetical protein
MRGGFLGSARLRMAVEEHGAGKQLFRFRIWPRYNTAMMLLALSFACLTIGATRDGSWVAGAGMGAIALVLVARSLFEGASSVAALAAATKRLDQS